MVGREYKWKCKSALLTSNLSSSECSSSLLADFLPSNLIKEHRKKVLHISSKFCAQLLDFITENIRIDNKLFKLINILNRMGGMALQYGVLLLATCRMGIINTGVNLGGTRNSLSPYLVKPIQSNVVLLFRAHKKELTYTSNFHFFREGDIFCRNSYQLGRKNSSKTDPGFISITSWAECML